MFVYGGINALQKTISVLLVPIYLRALSQGDFGALDILLSLKAFMILMFMLQIESSVSRFYYQAERNHQLKEFISSHLWFLALVLGCGGLLLLLSSSYFVNYFIPSVKNNTLLVMIIGLTLIPRGWTTVLLVILRFKDWKFKFGVAGILDTLTTTTLAVILVVIARWGIMGVLVGQLIGATVTSVYLLMVLRRDILFKISFENLRESLPYGLYLVPAIFFGWAQAYLNRFLMRLSGFELESIAIYALAFKFSLFITLAISAFKLIWQPEAMKAIGKEGSRDFYARVFHMYTSAMLVMGGVVILFAKPLIRIIAPPSYLPAATLVPFFIVASIIGCSGIFLGFGISISKKTFWSSFSVFWGAVVNAAILLLGVNHYGVWAVVAGYMGGIVLTTGISFLAAHSLYEIPYQKASLLGLLLASVLFCCYPFFDAMGFPNWSCLPFILSVILLSLLSADQKDVRKVWQIFMSQLPPAKRVT